MGPKEHVFVGSHQFVEYYYQLLRQCFGEVSMNCFFFLRTMLINYHEVSSLKCMQFIWFLLSLNQHNTYDGTLKVGFESGGRHSPSIIDPWSIIGDYSLVRVSTDLSSCFKRNPVALRMEVLCDTDACPIGGVGIYNPGYWGMVR